jgi:hypothetical protein
VYAGLDPLTGKRNYLQETIPPGQDARREAERARTRLLSQVDERRKPRTRATVAQLLDRWLEVLDVEASTRQGYVRKLDKHVRPLLARFRWAGSTPRRWSRSTRRFGRVGTTVAGGGGVSLTPLVGPDRVAELRGLVTPKTASFSYGQLELLCSIRD